MSEMDDSETAKINAEAAVIASRIWGILQSELEDYPLLDEAQAVRRLAGVTNGIVDSLVKLTSEYALADREGLIWFADILRDSFLERYGLENPESDKK